MLAGAYNVGGGAENSISLLEMLDFLRQNICEKEVVFSEERPGDQRVFYSDNTKLKEEKNMYKVELITQGKFEDLVYMWPNQFVQYRQTGDQVYDNTYFNELYGSIY